MSLCLCPFVPFLLYVTMKQNKFYPNEFLNSLPSDMRDIAYLKTQTGMDEDGIKEIIEGSDAPTVLAAQALTRVVNKWSMKEGYWYVRASEIFRYVYDDCIRGRVMDLRNPENERLKKLVDDDTERLKIILPACLKHEFIKRIKDSGQTASGWLTAQIMRFCGIPYYNELFNGRTSDDSLTALSGLIERLTNNIGQMFDGALKNKPAESEETRKIKNRLSAIYTIEKNMSQLAGRLDYLEAEEKRAHYLRFHSPEYVPRKKRDKGT